MLSMPRAADQSAPPPAREPTEGLAPLIVAEIEAVLARLKGEGLAILLVEQTLALPSLSRMRSPCSAGPSAGAAPPPNSPRRGREAFLVDSKRLIAKTASYRRTDHDNRLGGVRADKPAILQASG